MSDLLTRLRNKSRKERKVIALGVSGLVVAIIFSIWATALMGKLTQTQSEEALTESVETAQRASVIDSLKRKANLLFGEGSPLKELDFNFGEPIEYKSEVGAEDDFERDLQALLEEFNASSSAEMGATSSPQNDENSL